jgi:hypothetical protein
VLAGVQCIEIGNGINTEDNRLAVEHKTFLRLFRAASTIQG